MQIVDWSAEAESENMTKCLPFDCMQCNARYCCCNPVRPTLCLSLAWIVTKLIDALQIFWYRTKGQSLWYSDTNSGWWKTPSSVRNLRSNWPTPFETRRLRQIFVYNVSTVWDSEKSSIMTNRKSITGFSTNYRRSAYVTPKSHKGWLKNRFFRLKNKSQLQSNKVCYKVSLCENFQRQSCRAINQLWNRPNRKI